MQKCAYIKPGGARCGAPAMKGYQFCWGHRPDLAEERKRAASRAGKAGGRGRPKVTSEGRLAQVFVTCEYLIPNLLEGKLDTKIASAVIAAGHLLIRAIDTSLKIEEQRELRQQVEELEDKLEQERRADGYRSA
jgi:hypothetical protein